MRPLIILCLICVVYSLHIKYVDYLCIGSNPTLLNHCNELATTSRVWMTNVDQYNTSEVMYLVITGNKVTSAVVQTNEGIYELVISKEVYKPIPVSSPYL